MKQSDYLEHDAVGLAGLIARREVSAAEVLEAAVERLEAVNPSINAVIYTDLAAARAEAGQARSPGCRSWSRTTPPTSAAGRPRPARGSTSTRSPPPTRRSSAPIAAPAW